MRESKSLYADAYGLFVKLKKKDETGVQGKEWMTE